MRNYMGPRIDAWGSPWVIFSSPKICYHCVY